jgi:pimeloyl-ACP methyl ester carboxylesterase
MSKSPSLRLIAFLSLIGLPFRSPAQNAPVEPQPKTGTFAQRFKESHPLGSFAEITKRLRLERGFIQKHDPGAVHKIGDESFFVHVPKNYSSKGGFGLLVWISPSPQGNCGADWPAALEKHRLIHIGANKSGNNRFIWHRIALALDAVRNMTERYKIDPDRIYVVGHSGGGRLASTLAMLWPDVIRGGVYCCGVNHFRKIKKPGQKFYWPAKFQKPSGKNLGLAKRSSRHVILNGEKDFNLVHSRAVYRDLKQKHGFKRITMLEMKGRGHAAPDNNWLSKSIEALDAPLFAERKKAARRKKEKADRANRRQHPVR